MAITVDHLKFFASERMTDNSDGGGQMTAIEIVSGESNNIFDDLSDVDRASGDVSIRKVFAAVTSADTDKYLDAGVTIFAPPEDADTTCLGLSTGDFYDERAAIADAVGQYRARGIDTKLRLIGTHLPNQRVLYGYMLKPVAKLPAALFYNTVLSVASEANEVITQEQFVRVMRVTVTDAQYTYLVNDVQTLFDVYEVVLDLTGPLQYTFEGAEEDPSGDYTPPTVIRTTSVVAPYLYCGVTTLATTAALGATTIELDDTKALLAPMDYQDLGSTEERLPARPRTYTFNVDADWFRTATARTQTATAPDGFSLTVTLPNSNEVLEAEVFYQYGGDWIASGEPNAASYYTSGTVSFPLRPDAGSLIYLQWYNSVIETIPYETDGLWVGTDFLLRCPAPLISGSVIVGANADDDDALLVSTTDNGAGALSGNSITGTVDYVTGLVTATFPEDVKSETFFVQYRLGGYLPQPANLLGIDAVRLPKDGRMPIFTDNQLALIHHTDTVVEAALSPSEVIDCGRTSLYRVTIDDVAGQRLPASFYSVDRALGTVTMSPTLDLTGYAGSYTIYHTIADLRRINRVSHSLKTLTLTLGLSRQFVADETRVSSVLFIGTMQARYTKLFGQSAWAGDWSDSLIGDEPLAQYNDTLYPIDVSNLGAYTDRFLVKFTSSAAFQVIGENLGLIAIGATNADCAPFNSLTGQPYFTIDYRGWGAGWATGNCLRFNLIGANYPIDLIRSVQSSAPTGLDDSVELLFLGNVDA